MSIKRNEYIDGLLLASKFNESKLRNLIMLDMIEKVPSVLSLISMFEDSDVDKVVNVLVKKLIESAPKNCYLINYHRNNNGTTVLGSKRILADSVHGALSEFSEIEPNGVVTSIIKQSD